MKQYLVYHVWYKITVVRQNFWLIVLALVYLATIAVTLSGTHKVCIKTLAKNLYNFFRQRHYTNSWHDLEASGRAVHIGIHNSLTRMQD